MSIKVFLDDYNLFRVYDAAPEFLDGLTIINGVEEIGFEKTFRENCIELRIARDIDLDKKTILYKNNEKYPVNYRLVLHTKRFEDEYIPDLKLLGSSYFENFTLFRVWAPFKDEVNVVVNNEVFPMTKMEKGVWQVLVRGNLEKAAYHYAMINNGIEQNVIDPFAYAICHDGKNSYVINTDKISKQKIETAEVADPIIYELSVRDFSSYGEIFKSKRKLNALIEGQLTLENKDVGLEYLKNLGITHIQLMPIMDFDNDGSDYNWGYNPVNYNNFKLDYFDSIDPYGQIGELQNVVNNLHINNLKVILDVVYNHVYNKDSFVLNKLLPNYFYRYIDDKLADGAGLGNEIRTESKFMSEYLTLINKRLVDIYDIDGLRFDLSGLVDKNTCINIRNTIIQEKPDFIMIGEGWDMGEALSPSEKCKYENAKDIEGFLFFNPRFKRTVVGEDNVKGLALGNEALREEIKKTFVCYDYCLDMKQSLNYTECHDGYTVFDFIKNQNNDDDELTKKRCKLALALTVLAKGTPFIHAGQEFLRTKLNERNSYNKSDMINNLNWSLRVKNSDVVEYTKELIKLRRNILSYSSEENIGFEDYFELIVININDLKILINPCPFDHIYNKNIIYETIFDGEKNCNIMDSAINVKAYSIAIAKVIG